MVLFRFTTPIIMLGGSDSPYDPLLVKGEGGHKVEGERVIRDGGRG